MPSAPPPRVRLVDPDEIDVELDAQAESLSVDAQPAELAADAPIEIVAPPADEAERDPDASRGHDTGDLYGLRLPHAGDTELAAPEDRDAFEGADRGETWLEALEEHAAAMGPIPEEEIVIVDERDAEHVGHRHHPTERDRPVADKGGGGTGGL